MIVAFFAALLPIRSLLAGESLTIVPQSIELSGDAPQHGLLVTYVDETGHAIDVTPKCRFTSSESGVVTCSSAVCQAVADGRADVTAEFNGLTARVAVSVKDAAAAVKPSFRQDIVPILTKTGCNMGSCHGKLAGQNGFKLSLRGYAPEWDYESLTGDLGSRRIDFAQPQASLLLRKPTGQTPHEGGRRFAEDSRAFKVLLEWVKARAPGPDKTEADAATLEVLPDSRIVQIGDAQQLLVRAHWPDGRVRDVTWLCQFFSNDASIVSVNENGLVKSLRHGETFVRVHFQGQVSVVQFTAPYDAVVDPSLFTAGNNVIDRCAMPKLAALHIPPAELCDDATFIRRAYLDTIGALATPAEVRDFLADTSADKRSRLIDALLERPEYVDYWTLQLGDLLQNRRERDHDARGSKGTRSMHEWIRQQVAKNRPWNLLTRDVLTASGDAVTHPEIGYFIVLMGEHQNVGESDVTDSVAQAFLGTRIGCARCHNHPLEKYTQDDYYHFAAFFSRSSLKRPQGDKGGVCELNAFSRDEMEARRRLADVQQKIEVAQDQLLSAKPDELLKSQKALDALLKREEEMESEAEQVAQRPPTVTQPRTGQPMMPQPLDRSAVQLPPGGDSRAALVDWMTNPKNDYFSGAMVNRLWKHFMGVGLVEPVDDLRSSNPPTNPALMQALREEFVSHGYDLKHVMRLILNSRMYQLSSDTCPANEIDHRCYSHYYARRLPAEVMSDAISAATGIPDQFPGYPVGLRAAQLPDPYVASYFLTTFGRSERVTACACERNDEVSLSQLLHLNNGDVSSKITAPGGALAKILAASTDEPKTTEEVFLTFFGRLPNSGEREAVTRALTDGSPRDEVYRDLAWAMLNSKEFAFNH